MHGHEVATCTGMRSLRTLNIADNECGDRAAQEVTRVTAVPQVGVHQGQGLLASGSVLMHDVHEASMDLCHYAAARPLCCRAQLLDVIYSRFSWLCTWHMT